MSACENFVNSQRQASHNFAITNHRGLWQLNTHTHNLSEIGLIKERVTRTLSCCLQRFSVTDSCLAFSCSCFSCQVRFLFLLEWLAFLGDCFEDVSFLCVCFWGFSFGVALLPSGLRKQHRCLSAGISMPDWFLLATQKICLVRNMKKPHQ